MKVFLAVQQEWINSIQVDLVSKVQSTVDQNLRQM
jgi:hypothetical protein